MAYSGNQTTRMSLSGIMTRLTGSFAGKLIAVITGHTILLSKETTTCILSGETTTTLLNKESNTIIL